MAKIQIHPPILQGIHEALRQIFEEGYYADKVLERTFKSNRRWGSRDRRAVAETVYEVVRNYRLLYALAEKKLGFDPSALKILIFIWLEAFQDSFEVENSPVRGKRGEILDFVSELTPQEQHSIPDWLDQEMVRQRGEESWAELRSSLNEMAPVFLRVNTLKISSPQDLVDELADEGIRSQKVSDLAVMLPERKNVVQTKAFKAGHFEVQDLHSQEAALTLNPQPGDWVIDACAGAGGKSLQMAAMMKNKGKVIALDIQENKLSQLKLRARRAGVQNLEIRPIESSKVIKRLHGKADRLLLDVPCTGVGVLRRNPDTKWKLTLERLRELEKIQKSILADYSKMVKPGGEMVYSTCSLFPSENLKQVEGFLAAHPDFELKFEKEFFPGPSVGDGFYVALLQKKK